MKSFFGLIAAAFGLGSFGRSAKELTFDAEDFETGKAFAHGGKSKRRRHNSGTSSNCRNQPKGYYDQEITDPKYMTPRQREIHAQGIKIILGKCYPQPR